MDGYAIRAADVAGAGEADPVRLTVVGEVRAGVAPDARVLGGTAIRIATGAPLPPGADAVVPVELTTPRRRGRRSPGRAAARRPARCRRRAWSTSRSTPGNAVRAAGSDVAAGVVLAEPGTPVTPAVVALVAGAGVDAVTVRRRPIVAVLATGDEVRPPGERPRAGRDPGRERPGAPRARPRGRRRAAGARDRRRPARGRGGAAAARARRRRTSSSSRAACRSGPYDVVREAFDAVGHIEPVAGRDPARQAVRVRAGGRRRPRPAGAAVRAAGQPRVLVRDVRAVRAAGDPSPGGPRAAPPAGGPRRARGAGDARAWAGAGSSAWSR